MGAVGSSLRGKTDGKGDGEEKQKHINVGGGWRAVDNVTPGAVWAGAVVSASPFSRQCCMQWS